VRAARVRAAAAVAVALTVLFIPAGAGAATPQANLPDIEDEVMCTICGTLLAESESPQADRERALIRRLIDRGESKDQIEDALVAQYGPRVLATPSGHGFDLVAWIVPGAAILLALGLIAFFLVRGRGRRRSAGDPASELDPADRARLDRDMSTYDL
jgi:cytochrome c-type biogenesis protein CcmH